jgi:hypothetical protein
VGKVLAAVVAVVVAVAVAVGLPVYYLRYTSPMIENDVSMVLTTNKTLTLAGGFSQLVDQGGDQDGGLVWQPGRNRYEVQGVQLNPLGLFSRTSIPCVWGILIACLPS